MTLQPGRPWWQLTLGEVEDGLATELVLSQHWFRWQNVAYCLRTTKYDSDDPDDNRGNRDTDWLCEGCASGFHENCLFYDTHERRYDVIFEESDYPTERDTMAIGILTNRHLKTILFKDEMLADDC